MKLNDRVANQKKQIADLEIKLERSHQLMAKWAGIALELVIYECENDPVLAEDLKPYLKKIMEHIIAEQPKD